MTRLPAGQIAPLCPSCGKKLWRDGHMSELYIKLEGNADGAGTCCMWCSAIWKLLLVDGELRLLSYTPDEMKIVGEVLEAAAKRFEVKRDMARMFDMPLEEYVEFEKHMDSLIGVSEL